MRTYKRKTNWGSTTLEQVKAAAKAVLRDGETKRGAALDFGIPRMTLVRYLQKLKLKKSPTVGYVSSMKVFDDKQECSLRDNLLKASALHYRLTTRTARSLAYLWAVKLNVRFPESWKANKMAGKDWLTAFLRRHTELSIRRPQAARPQRGASSQTKDDLLDESGNILEKHKITDSGIQNIKETDVSLDDCHGKVYNPELNASESQQSHQLKVDVKREVDIEAEELDASESDQTLQLKVKIEIDIENVDSPQPAIRSTLVNPSTSRAYELLSTKMLHSSKATQTPEKGILTFKQILLQENSCRKSKTNIQKIQKTQASTKMPKMKQMDLERSSDDPRVEYCCLVCDKTYSYLSGEEWIPCYKCSKWVHIKCAAGIGPMYVCLLCDNESDYEC